ncbi:purine-nucleoside phosphorylase [Pelagibacterium xiamenense]|uniref:purine-nucleoside phosphorylase n=1 Tax=Pelagibacterium xiamenense TaxID=2901140 RepID=UPI001E6142DA|nr:purine-nucleoside phosphorylase [Pelagibacterium xiamenense]MCD7058856.1 purine-nucleoside phosphorylase [Pelagibacterium xiamenense]
MTKAIKTIRKHAGEETIEAALILGSGLSDIGDLLADKVTIPFEELKGFPSGGVSGHGKDLIVGMLGGKRIAVLTGRQHYYEHGNAAAMRPALEAMAELGAKTLMLTNSAGSLDPEVRPGDLMLLSDHINYAGMNPLIGEESDARFVNMVDAYDPGLRAKTHEIGARMDIGLKDGVYLWYSGPSFETPAEIQMAIRLGANAVGMSTAPEVILGRFLGLKVWACSSITNMGAGLMKGEEISHTQTKQMAKLGAEKLKRLIPALVEEI